MATDRSILRSLLVYGLCLPVAILLGYMLADPLTVSTFTIVGVILVILCLPLLLKWHYVWLIAVWNMHLRLFFVPGYPPAWPFMAAFSFLVALAQYILDRRQSFYYVPSITRPLVFLTAVVLITAKLTGGMGMNVLGSSTHGGKRYLFILCAILGYFALTSVRVPPRKRMLYATLFFLGQATFAIGSLAEIGSPIFYPVLLLFPDPGDKAAAASHISRLGGLSAACLAFVYVMMTRLGIQEIFQPKKPWRAFVFVLLMICSLYGGFRSNLILPLMIFSIVFYLEGLVRSWLMPTMIVATLLAGTLALPFINRLPLSVQRTLSFLPIPIDPLAKIDADASSEWRIQIWNHVLPQVPEYLIIGKGYSINPADAQYLSSVGSFGDDLFGAEIAGDYHNGPLSVILPFGIFGAAAFLWFLWSTFRMLQNNYHFGDPDCARINRFLLAFFIAKVLLFFIIFGGFYSDLSMFTGIAGLSVSLNGGVAKPMVVPQPKAAARLRLPTPRKKPAVTG